ncbi:MAG: DUF3047 domain-containing protein [Comamonadaceae bacterium]|nr:DUF3047 domain-containing protein [Comamonadaceae bacterium]
MTRKRTCLELALCLTCPLQAQAAEVALVPLASAQSEQAPAPWRVVGVPGGKIPLTGFAMVELDGRKVLRVTASRSYGNLVHDLPPTTPLVGLRLSWRWRLDVGLKATDLSTRLGDDSPLKVCVLFDMPLDKLGLIERNLLRLARAASAEKLPSATLCYVWDDKLSAETMLPNAYTGRVRMIAATSGKTAAPGQWVAQTRDVAADFRRAFGAESDSLPPVMAVLVGGDADNTGGNSLGYVDDLTLVR